MCYKFEMPPGSKPLKPTETVVAAWVRLLRAQTQTFAAVEQAMKEAGHPKLEWYDVLLELERGGPMRPRDLQARLLFAQYNLSRLLDRMVAAGVIARDECPEDQRGSIASITAAGRTLRRRMWVTYGPAIADVIGRKLSDDEAAELARLLGKLSEH